LFPTARNPGCACKAGTSNLKPPTDWPVDSDVF
jgi:hypothetical protein